MEAVSPLLDSPPNYYIISNHFCATLSLFYFEILAGRNTFSDQNPGSRKSAFICLAMSTPHQSRLTSKWLYMCVGSAKKERKTPSCWATHTCMWVWQQRVETAESEGGYIFFYFFDLVEQTREITGCDDNKRERDGEADRGREGWMRGEKKANDRQTCEKNQHCYE